MKSNLSRPITTFCSLLFLLPLSIHASEHRLVEKPVSNGLLKDSWIATYEADDFTDQVKEAKIIYIPQNYRNEQAFFMRCSEYFANFSVQYVEHENDLKESDGSLPNASAHFAKHGYVYDDKHTLKVRTTQGSEIYKVSVGGQNKHLTQLFETDIPKQEGLLGMSFHYSFTYKEMPSFRPGKNDSQTEAFFHQFKTALTENAKIEFSLESNHGLQHSFSLDSKRLNDFVPKEVMEFCFTGRSLN